MRNSAAAAGAARPSRPTRRTRRTWRSGRRPARRLTRASARSKLHRVAPQRHNALLLQKVKRPRRSEHDMALALGDTAPDFEAQTTEGPIKFHEWIGDSWAVLFSHPKDFTPVCTTELGYMASIKPEFDKRGVKIIGLSVDPTDKHEQWADDIEETQGTRPNYPLIGDSDYQVSKM